MPSRDLPPKPPRKHSGETAEEREARHAYYREKRRRRKRRKAVRRTAIAAVVAAAALGVGAWVWTATSSGDSSPPRATEAPSRAPDAQRTGPVVVDVLSDSHVYNGNSWFRQTIGDGTVPGAVAGTFASFPGADIARVTKGLDQIAGAQALVVSAGTNDLLGGAEPAEVSDRLRVLVAEAEQRAKRVLVSLLPPNDEKPAEVAVTNRLVRDWATAEGLVVIDVFSPVSDGTGRWATGLSGDGIHANDNGAAIMARAAEMQLRSHFG